MKVLIISDDNEFVSKVDSFFKEEGFDTIKYKWLLKALDNIEEIEPNVIILSSSEYPRHWKTLVQYAKSGIAGEKVDVYLYESNPLSSEEIDKAKALGISGSFSRLDKGDLVSTFSEYLNLGNKSIDQIDIISEESSNSEVKKNDEQTINEIVESYDESEDYNDEEELPTVDSIVMENVRPARVLLTNPATNGLVCGTVLSFTNDRIEAQLDVSLDGISNNDFIPFITYHENDRCFSFNGEIFILNENSNTVILSIQDQYEKI